MALRRSDDIRIVHSTDAGRLCPNCSRTLESCRCGPGSKQSPPSKGRAAVSASFPDDGTVRLVRDRKGRRGKTVTVVHGLTGNADALKTLAKELKKKCGTGGAVKGVTLEFQGDHVEVLEAQLRARGHVVKRVGG